MKYFLLTIGLCLLGLGIAVAVYANNVDDTANATVFGQEFSVERFWDEDKNIIEENKDVALAGGIGVAAFGLILSTACIVSIGKK